MTRVRNEAIWQMYFTTEVYRMLNDNLTTYKITIKHLNTQTNIKYNLDTCIQLLKRFVECQSRLKFFKNGQKTGIGNGIYFVNSLKCENYADCAYKDKYDNYIELPELPNAKCMNEYGCTCYYSYK